MLELLLNCYSYLNMMNNSNSKVLIVVLLLTVLLSTSVKFSEQLRFKSIRIPSLVAQGANFWLICEPDFGSQQQQRQLPELQIYSAKWYRNNAEFYRLLAASPQQQQQQQQQHQQQLFDSQSVDKLQTAASRQFFAQGELNVMMSASNATHVKVLNASSDISGVFGCEISTQNLSTIRFEKQIRVFVPASKSLQVVGLRASYSPGDSVELTCVSDYTQPRARLAWYFNGKRVINNAHNNNGNVESLQLNAELSERLHLDASKQLTRSTLTIKFKLTRALLTELQVQQQLVRRKLLLATSNSTQINAQQQQQQQQQTVAVLKVLVGLQCKSRIVAVSDVSVDELTLSQSTLTATSTNIDIATPTVDALSYSAQNARLITRNLAKSTDNRIVRRQSARATGGCELGSLALVDSDPLIVDASSNAPPPPPLQQSMTEHTVNNNDNELEDNNNSMRFEIEAQQQQQQQGRARRQLGKQLSLECRTLGSMLTRADERALASQSAFCGNEALVRRMLVVNSNSNNNNNINNNARHRHQPLASFVNIDFAAADSNQQQTLQTQQAMLRQPIKLALTANEFDIAFSNLNLQTHQQQHQQQHHQQQQQQQQLSALPPLLEWFVNDEQAASSAFATTATTAAAAAASKPLVLSANNSNSDDSDKRNDATNSDSDSNNDNNDDDGDNADRNERVVNDAQQSRNQQLQQTQADYEDYFASFADLRSSSSSKSFSPQLIHANSKLGLKLKLSKRHFATLDSKLKLQCYATHGQLLQVDEVSIAFIATTANSSSFAQTSALPLAGWQVSTPNTRLTNTNRKATTATNSKQLNASSSSNKITNSGALVAALISLLALIEFAV